MMAAKEKKLKILVAVNAILVLAAMALSIVSSATAYAFDIRTVILCCAAVAVLDLLCLVLADKLPGVVTDIALFAATVLSALAFCTVIQGRILLIGYIYFSDLESNNPVAVAAMNLSIAAWVCYLLGLIVIFIVGFSKHARD